MKLKAGRRVKGVESRMVSRYMDFCEQNGYCPTWPEMKEYGELYKAMGALFEAAGKEVKTA